MPPFYCQEREELFEQIRSKPVTFPPYLSHVSRSLLGGLLTKDPSKRIGCGAGESTLEIQSHTFFGSVDWDGLLRGQVQPPWRPQILHSLDTAQFDSEFTSMPLNASGGQTADAGEVPSETFPSFDFPSVSPAALATSTATDAGGGLADATVCLLGLRCGCCCAFRVLCRCVYCGVRVQVIAVFVCIAVYMYVYIYSDTYFVRR